MSIVKNVGGRVPTEDAQLPEGGARLGHQRLATRGPRRVGSRLMRWLLDSNVLIDALGGLPHEVRVLQEARKRPEVTGLGFFWAKGAFAERVLAELLRLPILEGVGTKACQRGIASHRHSWRAGT
ncbi:MAG TPA: hypothetical protein VH595_22090 [Verrucomicrobiae bacterium]|nr:hypothetical protein [Verrucomicrobiae bacterium]